MALSIAAACAGRNQPPPDQGVNGTLFTGARLLVGDGTAIEDGAFLVQSESRLTIIPNVPSEAIGGSAKSFRPILSEWPLRTWSRPAPAQLQDQPSR